MADHDRISAALERLLAMPEGERRAELKRLARNDPQQATELDSLLAAHEANPDFLSKIDVDGALNLLEEDGRLLMPERAGQFRLIREIGRGGLGVVYLGERVAGDFEQQVAIKLIKHGMDSVAILRRFRNERRILASLEHPNIARLVDGGMLDDGRPWFAMEYIRGEPITQWCNRKQLGIDDRLRLFEQVCRTVQFAHSRQIIHRDLKPDNILVTEENTIKLLDFGIAKLIAEDDEELTELTIAGHRAMTPEYAAPEQIRGDPVSVATDVYALGVVLYQLLTSVHPFKVNTSSRAELTDAICNMAPAPPSIAIRMSGTSNLPAARVRHGPEFRRLKGDLDAIVLTALAKAPARRFESAEALAEDIRRHLSDLPIRARRRTYAYKTGRFIARHRISVLATSTAMLALIVAIFVVDRFWPQSAFESAGEPPAAGETPEIGSAEATFIAVLPFDNFSPAAADGYFASGMTEEITNQLSRVSALRVISRTAVSRALESQLSLTELAATLGVDAVLEGSVRMTGDMVRITAQLVDANTGQHLWSDDFDRRLADVFAIQREVALAIVDALDAELTPAEQARIETTPSDNLAAYQLYLRAGELSRHAVAPNRTAIELLRQAVALDPDFVDAWASLSWRLTWAARHGDLEAIAEAFTSAHRALELDPQSPLAHFSLGSAYSVSEEIDEVIAAFERAVAIDPDHSTLADLSLFNARIGNLAVGLAQASRAIRLARNVPNIRFHGGMVLMGLGDDQRLQDWLDLAAAEGLEMHRLDMLRARLWSLQGHAEEALGLARVGLERWSGNEEFEHFVADQQLFHGQGREVRSYFDRQAQLAPDRRRGFHHLSTRSSFALLLHEEGDVERATSLFTDALGINETMFADGRGWPYRWVESAAIHALYGRHEEALVWLQRAVQAGHFEPRLIAQDRMFASLRDDPRFRSVLTKMTEAQAAQRARVEAEDIGSELDAMIAAGLERAP
jgi:eukaryotic-like serine/threonine-protein kinase